MDIDIINEMRKRNTAPIKIDEEKFLELYASRHEKEIDESKKPITLFRNIVSEYDHFINYVNKKDNRVLFNEKHYALVDFKDEYKNVLKLKGHTFIKIKDHTKKLLKDFASIKKESIDSFISRMLSSIYFPLVSDSNPMSVYLDFAAKNIEYIKELECLSNICSDNGERVGISISNKNIALLKNLETLEFLKNYDAAIYFLFFLIFESKYRDYIINDDSEPLLNEKPYEEIKEWILNIKLEFGEQNKHFNDPYYEYMIKYIYLMKFEKEKIN